MIAGGEGRLGFGGAVEPETEVALAQIGRQPANGNFESHFDRDVKKTYRRGDEREDCAGIDRPGKETDRSVGVLIGRLRRRTDDDVGLGM